MSPRCALDPGSQGFIGVYSPEMDMGCVPRKCCEHACCGEGQYYDPSIALCLVAGSYVPTDSPTASPTFVETPGGPTDSPTDVPTTTCERTEGNTFTFDQYIRDNVLLDDILVHQQFIITAKCDCNGKAVDGGTVGPTTLVNLVDEAGVDGPFLQVANDKELQVDWEGGALEEADTPGWTIVATGAGLCFTPVAEADICIAIEDINTEISDTDILWGYRRSVLFKCVEFGDSWEVKMKSNSPGYFQSFGKSSDYANYGTDFSFMSTATTSPTDSPTDSPTGGGPTPAPAPTGLQDAQ